MLLPWLFVSWCQSCHIYHGRVVRGVSVWPTRICLCRAPANEFAHAAGTPSLATLLLSPLLLLLLLLQGNCCAVPRSHHAAFVPAQARVRFDFNTATLAVVIAIGRHLQGQQEVLERRGRGGVPPLGFQTYVSLIIYVSARCEFKFCLLIARVDQRLLCLPAGHLCLRLPLCLYLSPSLSCSPFFCLFLPLLWPL